MSHGSGINGFSVDDGRVAISNGEERSFIQGDDSDVLEVTAALSRGDASRLNLEEDGVRAHVAEVLKEAVETEDEFWRVVNPVSTATSSIQSMHTEVMRVFDTGPD